jgi:DNA mismatch endonuclease (patch repair protein)
MNNGVLGLFVDILSPTERSDCMARVRSKDTKPEMLMIHRIGFRYRLHRRDLPGSPDIVFSSRRKVIFVHGCFWHRHSRCKLARRPKSRQEFWVPKLEGNRLRDLKNQISLRQQGWESMIVWECQIKDQAQLAARIKAFLANADEARKVA